MTTEKMTFFTIHLFIPLTGLLAYLLLVWKMKRDKVESSPVIDLFFIFATYGGLLLVVLTTLSWKWSAMASLGCFYLFLGAPLVMGVIAFRNYKRKQLSIYHRWTFLSGLLYFIIAPLTFMVVEELV